MKVVKRFWNSSVVVRRDTHVDHRGSRRVGQVLGGQNRDDNVLSVGHACDSCRCTVGRARAYRHASMTQPIEVILMRELADHLATPIFVVDPAGDLLFYNDPAERLLGSRFAETGMMPFAEWTTTFTPTGADGEAIPPDELPLAIAVQQHHPAQGDMWIRGLDGERRQITVTAIPLEGQWGEHLGAAAIFWETT